MPATIHSASWMNDVAAAARIFAASNCAGSSIATSSSAMRLVFSSATDVMIACALSRIARYSRMTNRYATPFAASAALASANRPDTSCTSTGTFAPDSMRAVGTPSASASCSVPRSRPSESRTVDGSRAYAVTRNPPGRCASTATADALPCASRNATFGVPEIAGTTAVTS